MFCVRQSSVRGCRFSFVFVFIIIKCVKCSPVPASFFPYISSSLHPALLNLIEMFGKFSGYKINNSKSVLLYLHKAERLSPPVQSPFTISQEGFTYLGIKITPTVNEIVAANYKPISDYITGLLNRWPKLPIS